MITDVMRYAIEVPGVPTERMMELGAVISARNAVPYRPAWAGIFAKACALTARDYPELRRTYVKSAVAAPLRVSTQHRHYNDSTASTTASPASFHY